MASKNRWSIKEKKKKKVPPHFQNRPKIPKYLMIFPFLPLNLHKSWLYWLIKLNPNECSKGENQGMILNKGNGCLRICFHFQMSDFQLKCQSEVISGSAKFCKLHDIAFNLIDISIFTLLRIIFFINFLCLNIYKIDLFDPVSSLIDIGVFK